MPEMRCAAFLSAGARYGQLRVLRHRVRDCGHRGDVRAGAGSREARGRNKRSRIRHGRSGRRVVAGGERRHGHADLLGVRRGARLRRQYDGDGVRLLRQPQHDAGEVRGHGEAGLHPAVQEDEKRGAGGAAGLLQGQVPAARWLRRSQPHEGHPGDVRAVLALRCRCLRAGQLPRGERCAPRDGR